MRIAFFPVRTAAHVAMIASCAVACDGAATAPPANARDDGSAPAPIETAAPAVDTAAPPVPPLPSPSSDYVLVEEHAGATFFDGFDFEAIADPTHGAVRYVDEATARKLGLAAVDAEGHARISVESTKVAPAGRDSVRLRSKASYEDGLFIIDVRHMPEGNAVWPAFWTVGAAWPRGGEIDVIEGVNDPSRNASTLHTTAGCSMAGIDAASTMTGKYTERDCNAGDKTTGMPYIGCGVTGPEGAFGPAFNANGGGVFAMRRTTESIDVWAWSRAAIPPDIAVGRAPLPDTWGKPVAHFALGSACTPDHFGPHRIILNTTLCGDWAGNVFVGKKGEKGPSACRDFVGKEPSAFRNAYWDIAYIRTFGSKASRP